MNVFALFAIIVISIIVVIFVIYAFGSNTGILSHSISFGGKKLFSSDNPIIASSDTINTILYATPKGVVLYNTDAGTSSVINATIAVGLAYDADNDNFIVLNADTTLSKLERDGTLTFLQKGGLILYDLVDGYYLKTNSDIIYSTTSGDLTPANGNYGLIQLIVV